MHIRGFMISLWTKPPRCKLCNCVSDCSMYNTIQRQLVTCPLPVACHIPATCHISSAAVPTTYYIHRIPPHTSLELQWNAINAPFFTLRAQQVIILLLFKVCEPDQPIQGCLGLVSHTVKDVFTVRNSTTIHGWDWQNDRLWTKSSRCCSIL